MPTKKKRSLDEMDVRSLARVWTPVVIKTLAGVAQNGINESAKVAACAQLLDRGWGRPNQPVTGKDGEDIQVTIRTIIEKSKE